MLVTEGVVRTTNIELKGVPVGVVAEESEIHAPAGRLNVSVFAPLSRTPTSALVMFRIMIIFAAETAPKGTGMIVAGVAVG